MTSPGKPGAPFKRTVARFKDAPADWPEWWAYLRGHFVELRCRLVVSADNRIKKPAGEQPARAAKPKSALPIPPLDGRQDDLPRIANVKVEPGKELTYARYGLWHYVRPAKRDVKPYSDLHRAGMNLRGLIRAMLFKRFESSVYAFRETIKRLIKAHALFLASLERGFVPAGDRAEVLFVRVDTLDEEDLLIALENVSGRYDVADFDAEPLTEHVKADIALLRKIQRMVEPITPEQDAKLQALKARLERSPIKGNKCLIFTQYADTAIYVYENLNPGGRAKDIEVIYGTD
jgi:hypothetical protein